MVHYFSDLETQEACAGANVKTGEVRLKFHSYFIDLPYFTPDGMHRGNEMLRRAADEVHRVRQNKPVARETDKGEGEH